MNEKFLQLVTLRKFGDAVTILASDKSLQTEKNILACCENEELAISLLRFVPRARSMQKIIDTASENKRFARLIFEDFEEHRTFQQFLSATENDTELKRHYISKFKLPQEWDDTPQDAVKENHVEAVSQL